MKLNSQQAVALAKYYRDLSVALGDYRFAHWTSLKPKERQEMEDTEWTLLNYASDFTTQAVGLLLDETQLAWGQLQHVLEKTKKALRTVKQANKVLQTAFAALGLAAAIAIREGDAIAKNAQALEKILKS